MKFYCHEIYNVAIQIAQLQENDLVYLHLI